MDEAFRVDPTGLDYLIEIGKESYVCSPRDKLLKKGDRLAVLGRGTAVVERVNSGWIQAVVLNRCTLMIAHNNIRWDGRYMLWEAKRLQSRVSRQIKKPERSHRSFAHSALASFRMGMSGSESSQGR